MASSSAGPSRPSSPASAVGSLRRRGPGRPKKEPAGEWREEDVSLEKLTGIRKTLAQDSALPSAVGPPSRALHTAPPLTPSGHAFQDTLLLLHHYTSHFYSSHSLLSNLLTPAEHAATAPSRRRLRERLARIEHARKLAQRAEAVEARRREVQARRDAAALEIEQDRLLDGVRVGRLLPVRVVDGREETQAEARERLEAAVVERGERKARERAKVYRTDVHPQDDDLDAAIEEEERFKSKGGRGDAADVGSATPLREMQEEEEEGGKELDEMMQGILPLEGEDEAELGRKNMLKVGKDMRFAFDGSALMAIGILLQEKTAQLLLEAGYASRPPSLPKEPLVVDDDDDAASGSDHKSDSSSSFGDSDAPSKPSSPRSSAAPPTQEAIVASLNNRRRKSRDSVSGAPRPKRTRRDQGGF